MGQEDKIPEIFTADEVAKKLKTTRRTINNYVKAGLLRGNHIGKNLVFLEEDVVDFIKTGRTKGYFERVAPPSKRKNRATTAGTQPADEMSEKTEPAKREDAK